MCVKLGLLGCAYSAVYSCHATVRCFHVKVLVKYRKRECTVCVKYRELHCRVCKVK